jgi:hypothetical protein
MALDTQESAPAVFTARHLQPHKAHRTKRVLRRHADLLDFLTRAAFAVPRWLPGGEQRAQLARQATAHWRPRRVL